MNRQIRIVIFSCVMLFVPGWALYTYIEIRSGNVSHDGYLDVDLESIGFFSMDPKSATINDIPIVFHKLDGKKVRLQGYIYRLDVDYGKVKSFTLVCRVPYEGHNPRKVQDAVICTVNQDASVTYAGGDGQYYDVMGVLHITMKRDPITNEIVEVYHLDVEKLAPTKL